jgi:hypothetical protein
MKRYSIQHEFQINSSLSIVVASLNTAFDSFRDKFDADYFRFQVHKKGSEVGFLLHTEKSDALRYGNMGWIVAREIGARTVAFSISEVPYPSREIYLEDLGEFNPSIFGVVQWSDKYKEIPSGQDYVQILPEIEEDLEYNLAIDSAKHQDRGSSQIDLSQEILAQFERDGLIKSIQEPGEKIDKGMSQRNKEELSKFKEFRLTYTRMGRKPPLKTIAVERFDIDRKTIVKYDREWWENYNKLDYQ